jgi:hypothetical protein
MCRKTLLARSRKFLALNTSAVTPFHILVIVASTRQIYARELCQARRGEMERNFCIVPFSLDAILPRISEMLGSLFDCTKGNL